MKQFAKNQPPWHLSGALFLVLFLGEQKKNPPEAKKTKKHHPKQLSWRSGYLSLSFLFLFFFTSCRPEPYIPPPPDRVTQIPEFEDYAIPHFKIYKEKTRPVNLVSHPRAIRFKDRLMQGAKIGPNFAGDQSIVRIPCGEECQQFAIIDARTGTVIFAPFVTHLGFRFRLDSKLLIVNPLEEVERAALSGKSKSHYRTTYYVWHYGEFTEIYSIRN